MSTCNGAAATYLQLAQRFTRQAFELTVVGVS